MTEVVPTNLATGKMDGLMRLLCLLCTLVVPGFSLSCTTCLSETSSSCTGISQTCASEYVCASVYRITNSAFVSDGIARFCAPQSKCNAIGTMTVFGVRVTMGVRCCSTDDCIPVIPSAPTKSPLPNKQKCKECYSSNSACDTNNYINCTGVEDQCVFYTQTWSEGSGVSVSSSRGCGTRSLCDFQSYSYSIGPYNVQHAFLCNHVRGISATFSNAGILSVAAVFLLMNLF